MKLVLFVLNRHLNTFITGTLCNGRSSCCIPGIPCREGEGDCNTNLDCMEGLVCGHNNCPKKSGQNWDLADDCCYKPPKGII